jgi:hypothetical protein
MTVTQPQQVYFESFIKCTVEQRKKPEKTSASLILSFGAAHKWLNMIAARRPTSFSRPSVRHWRQTLESDDSPAIFPRPRSAQKGFGNDRAGGRDKNGLHMFGVNFCCH